MAEYSDGTHLDAPVLSFSRCRRIDGYGLVKVVVVPTCGVHWDFAAVFIVRKACAEAGTMRPGPLFLRKMLRETRAVKTRTPRAVLYSRTGAAPSLPWSSVSDRMPRLMNALNGSGVSLLIIRYYPPGRPSGCCIARAEMHRATPSTTCPRASSAESHCQQVP